MNLETQIDSFFAVTARELDGQRATDALAAFKEFKSGLNAGRIRAAARDEHGQWVANPWVKRGILLGFRLGAIRDYSIDDNFRYFDKHTFPTKRLSVTDGVRVVPGGSSVRDGVYLAPGITIMPPAFINVGAYVGEGTMIDSHALVGSCAQVGARCHISAAAQIGGVLEPVGALPVIIEDDVLVGGNCGVYEGAVVRERAILAAGVIVTGSTPVFDVIRGQIYRRQGDQPLEIPAGAVVVPGSRALTSGHGHEWGISLYTPVIIKYRDEKTDASAQLEELLR